MPRGDPWYHFLRYDPKNPHLLRAGFDPPTQRLELLRANRVVPWAGSRQLSTFRWCESPSCRGGCVALALITPWLRQVAFPF